MAPWNGPNNNIGSENVGVYRSAKIACTRRGTCLVSCRRRMRLFVPFLRRLYDIPAIRETDASQLRLSLLKINRASVRL